MAPVIPPPMMATAFAFDDVADIDWLGAYGFLLYHVICCR